MGHFDTNKLLNYKHIFTAKNICKRILFFFRIRINVLESRFIICFIGQIMQRILLQYEMKEHDIHTNQTVLVKKNY